MTLTRLAVAAGLLALSALPAFAWTTLQGEGEVLVRKELPDYVIEIRCSADRGEALIFSLARTRGRSFDDVRSVMLWIEDPDGRLGRRPIDVTNHGQYVAGTWYVSDQVLSEFQSGVSMEIRSVGRTRS